MIDHVDRALDGERVFDLGQLSPRTLQELNRLVRFGVLVRRAQPCGRSAYELSLPNNLRKAILTIC